MEEDECFASFIPHSTPRHTVYAEGIGNAINPEGTRHRFGQVPLSTKPRHI